MAVFNERVVVQAPALVTPQAGPVWRFNSLPSASGLASSGAVVAQRAAPAPAPPTPEGLAAPAGLPPPPALELPPAPKAPPAPASSVSVAGERRAPVSAPNYSGALSGRSGDDAVDAQTSARRTAQPASIPALAGLSAPAALARFESPAGPQFDQAAKLRAAAAAGRTTEVEVLLAHGVPVDAPDADGNTALMKSIQADHPAVAVLLRRYGASLDYKSHAGERAKDMATAKGDAMLDQAIGVGP